MNNFHLALIAGAAALSYGAPSLAHPEHDASEEVVREVHVVTGDNGPRKEKRTELKVIRSGDGKGQHLGHMKADAAVNCTGRKFESAAETGSDKKNVSKIVLCADAGESEAEWSKTLKDALARVESSDRMPAESKAKIAADLRSEIAKYGK